MTSRRILITGLASVWGGRLAHQLEQDPRVETVVGLDTADPQHELQRTEFVRTQPEAGALVRILRAAAIDTIVETTLLPGGGGASPAKSRGTRARDLREMLDAAARGRVAKVVVGSSAEYYGTGPDAPAFFTEDMAPLRRSRTPEQRELVGAERAVREFAEDHPRCTVTVLRCTFAVGGGLRGAHLSLLGLPVIPSVLGFDPRWQFVHEDDVLGALTHAVGEQLPGAYNVAGDGVLALSEVAGLLGKGLLPVLPPWGTLFAAAQARRVGLPVPLVLLRELRYGRGLDNRRLKAAGYALRYTSRETILKLRDQQRIRPLLGSGHPDSYRYEPELEEFLRRSPSVRTTPKPPGPADETPDHNGSGAPGPDGSGTGGTASAGYSSLTQGELLEVIPSLETPAILQLREHEAAGPARRAVLTEIDHQLELRGSPDAR